MQNQYERIQQMSGMQRNMLRDYQPAEQTMAAMPREPQTYTELSPFPEQTPPGMAYVPFQQWEEPYDADMAFPVGTIFPALDFPYRGGGSCA
ncbi:spore coat associated protein CotJA [Ruminococcus sp.]|uniref:spore coat associated protein CotJA n=1 Tax=Ruminococcus sp. TaxID=41978 RepID=UPI0025E77E24|nr:spore coat associated protein CotJA [Ruminococcus sp.]